VTLTTHNDTSEAMANLKAAILQHQLEYTRPHIKINTDLIDAIQKAHAVNPHLPIGWPTLPAGIVPKLRAYTQKLLRRLLRFYINPVVEQQNAFNVAVLNLVYALLPTAQQQNEFNATVSESIAYVHTLQETWRPALEALETRLLALETSYPSTAGLRDLLPSQISPVQPDNGSALNIDEFDLGDYQDLFAELREGTRHELGRHYKVLVVGCDQGQSVEQLGETGLAIYGIDQEKEMVGWGRSLGRDIRQAEPLDYLSSLEPGSLAALVIPRAHEELPLGSVPQFLRAVNRSLAPGGLLILQALNPASLPMSASWYAHRRTGGLLPPDVACWLAEQAGFTCIQTRFLHHGTPASTMMTYTPPQPSLEALGLDEASWHAAIVSPRHYALIASRPEV
jgi:SAM-dependent methyltransferase